MLAEQFSSRLFRRCAPVGAVVTRWRKVIRRVRDHYRPELHYMRGPGPKWRAKHLGDVQGAMVD